MNTIELEHTTSTGHRIPNHRGGTGKCARLHGHTYCFCVELSAHWLDAESGMVADFGVIKAILDEWDHRTLLWDQDPLCLADDLGGVGLVDVRYGVIRVPYIPTAENMAKALAARFSATFDEVVYATVTVRESQTTSARAHCDKAYSASRGTSPAAVVS